jgi:two-component system KDP operon response regulator KdpE
MDRRPLLLVVEDDPSMRRFLRVSLASHGYRVLEAGTLCDAEQVARSHAPELLLLDLGLPDGDGVDLARAIRRQGDTPIVVISGRASPRDFAAALDAGADDYLRKPFGARELLERVQAALRRFRGGPRRELGGALEIGPLRLDVARCTVEVDGRRADLTPTECRVLAVLAGNAGRLLTFRRMLDDVWGLDAREDVARLRAVVADLRGKIERDPARPKIIATETGVGYRLVGS